jgi:CheY-like chemotaxis protein
MYLESIQRNARQLSSLIEDLLDLSKIEADRLQIEKKNFLLSDLLEDLRAVLGFKARAKNLSFTVESDGPVPATILSDQMRLRQVLVNVVGNAIKFTDHGEVALIIRAHVPQDDLAPMAIEFEVRDTGIGLNEEQQSQIFKPFAQGDSSFTRRFGGTGLGLVLSRKIAQSLGGDLKLKLSRKGEGSIFSVTIQTSPRIADGMQKIIRQTLREGLPLQSLSPRPSSQPLTTPPATQVASPPPVQTASSLKGRHVLLVEDSADNRTMIARFLQKEGAVIETANDGDEGVKKAFEKNPDLVLMDIQMPVCDGYKATNMLRGKGFDRPIVALTAHAMKEERERSLHSGFDDYLTKPVNRALLIDTIRKLTPESEMA